MSVLQPGNGCVHVCHAQLRREGQAAVLQLMNSFQKLKVVLLAMLLPQGGYSLALPSVPKSAQVRIDPVASNSISLCCRQ